MKRYIVASNKVWNIDRFVARRAILPGMWVTITDPRDLDAELIRFVAPKYVFFMHWSSIVPLDILNITECVCFHMADVPYGRGGSPLQNLIERGHEDTVLTALRMTKELDAGPVYAKAPLSLKGSAADIFRRCAELSLDLMDRIAREEPVPREQVGEATIFHRRTPDQSRLPTDGSVRTVYDHIRMLDAETYPHAFLDYGDYRIELTDARLDGAEDRVDASARISRRQLIAKG